MTQQERELTRRLELLEEQVRRLSAALQPPQIWPMWMPRLTAREETILGLLLSRPVLSRDMFEIAVAPASDDPRKLLDSFIFKMRQKLSKFGLEIESVRNLGYRLTPQSRQYLKAGVAEAKALSEAA